MDDAAIAQAMCKMSWSQRSILCWILEVTEWREQNGNDHNKRRLEFWGVHWQPSRGQQRWTRSDSAAVSRSLRRLEARGLVIRDNAISGSPSADGSRKSLDELPPKRACNVKLTELGRVVAKTVNKKYIPNVNHLDASDADDAATAGCQ